MNHEKFQTMAEELDKDLKTPEDLSQLISTFLTKLTVEAALKDEMNNFLGQPSIQPAFLNAVETPIAQCIMRSKDTVETAIQLAESEGVSSASWEKDGYRYLLMSGEDTILIEETANVFSYVI